MTTIEELSKRLEDYKRENFELRDRVSALARERNTLKRERDAYMKILIALGEKL